jgi:hypothetical protein
MSRNGHLVWRSGAIQNQRCGRGREPYEKWNIRFLTVGDGPFLRATSLIVEAY